jgi:hypothetical protein
MESCCTFKKIAYLCEAYCNIAYGRWEDNIRMDPKQIRRYQYEKLD